MQELWLCLVTTAPPEQAASAALAWTPRISTEPPDALLLEVGGSRRLLGGLGALRAEVERVFAVHGWPLRYALAPTPRAALWLARGAPGAWIESTASLAGTLGALPLTALDLDPEILERLCGFGLYTVRDLARLPRAALARRTGTALNEELACALGSRPDPRARWRPPARFSAMRSFEFGIASAGLLCRVLAPLFAELAAVLRAGSRGVRRCTVVFRHRGLPPTRVRIGVLDAVRDTARLEAQLALHLEQTPLPAPVIAVGLHAPRLVRVEEASRDLFAPRDSGEGWLSLVERLHARLGGQAVFGIRVHEDHRPEKAMRLDRTCGSGTPYRESRYGVSLLQPRPTWLLEPPRPLIGPRRHVLERGPERIESGWWDGEDAARDYFVARDARGARCWIFRERRAPCRWFVHGLFG